MGIIGDLNLLFDASRYCGAVSHKTSIVTRLGSFICVKPYSYEKFQEKPILAASPRLNRADFPAAR